MPGHRGTYSDTTGHFTLRDISPGSYRLTLSLVGYTSVTRHITVRIEKEIKMSILMQKAVKELNEVSITGKSAEQRLLKNISLEPVSLRNTVSVVEATAMEQEGAVTLIDALRYVPGGLTETRGRKVKQFFSIRGQTYPYPTYSYDGILQKEFYETTSFMNSGEIGEIRVDRSASALLKSLSPLTGVIDIVPRTFPKKTTEAFVSYGSLNTYNAGILHGKRTEKLEYSSSASFFGTDGPAGCNGRERVFNIHGSMRWQINSSVSTTLRIFYLGGIRQLVVPVAPAADKFRNQREKYDPLSTLLITSKTEYKVSQKVRGELQVNYARRNPKYFLELIPTGDLTTCREKDHELTLSHLNAWSVSPTNVMRFGVLYNHWLAPNGKRYYWGHRADVHTASAVVTDQQRLGKWLLDGGMRITREYYKEWSAFSIEGSGKYFTGVEPIRHQWQPPVWQAMAGASFAPGSSVSLHANTAAGIINPRKGAMTADGTPPLNEKRINLDAGVIRQCEEKGTLTVTLFHVSRIDAIDYSGETIAADSGQVIELYKNIDKRSYGLEGEMRREILSGKWEVFTNVLVMRGEEKDTVWQKDDEIPVFIGNTGTTLHLRNLDAGFYMNYTGPYKNDRFVSKTYLKEHGKAPLGDFFDLNLTAGYTVGRTVRVRFFSEIRNLLDRHYQTVPGWPDNGRTFRSGMKVKF
jgi:iron complex outermembrane receptor protein